MRRNWKKLLSFLLSFSMIFSMLSLPAYADEAAEAPGIQAAAEEAGAPEAEAPELQVEETSPAEEGEAAAAALVETSTEENASAKEDASKEEPSGEEKVSAEETPSAALEEVSEDGDSGELLPILYTNNDYMKYYDPDDYSILCSYDHVSGKLTFQNNTDDTLYVGVIKGDAASYEVVDLTEAWNSDDIEKATLAKQKSGELDLGAFYNGSLYIIATRNASSVKGKDWGSYFGHVSSKPSVETDDIGYNYNMVVVTYSSENGGTVSVNSYDYMGKVTIFLSDEYIDTDFHSVDDKFKPYMVTLDPANSKDEPVSKTINPIPADSNSDGNVWVYYSYGDGTDGKWKYTSLKRQEKEYKYCTVSFNANGGNGTMENRIMRTSYYNEIPECGFTREGYTFLYWNTKADNGGNKYNVGNNYLDDEGTAVTFYAIWLKDGEYTIHFDKNAEDATGTMADQVISTGISDALKPCAFTREGYSFRGWGIDRDAYYPYYYDKSSVYNLAGDGETVTLYAIWEEEGEYTIHFDKNAEDATGTMADQTASLGNSYRLNANAFTRPGYEFKGWITDPGATYIQYNDKEYVYNLAGNGETITLYAIWDKIESYEISFNGCGGEGSMANMTLGLEEEKKLTKNSFTRLGYAFKGWAISEGGPVAYADEATVNNLGSDEDVVILYAVWEEVGTYEVSFNGNGGEGTMGKMLFTVGEKKSLSKNSFTRPGYEFKGWAVSENGAVAYRDGAAVEDLAEKYGAVTLYAVWEKIGSYTVSFNSNGGEGTMESQTISRNKAEKLSKNTFTRQGYTFKGWSESAEGEVKYTDEQEVTNLAENDKTIELFAVWINNAEVKTWKIKAATGVRVTKAGAEIVSAIAGDKIDIEYILNQEGVEFDGWVINGATVSNANAAKTQFTMGESDVSISFKTKVASEAAMETLPSGADTTTKISKLSFTKKSLKLKAGQSELNAATATGGSATIYYITSNSDVVAVSQNGLFIARGVGSTTVTAYCGTKKDTCKVTVNSYTEDIAITDIEGNEIASYTMQGGEQTIFGIDFKPYDTTDPRTIKWKSSNKKAVTVNNGVISAKEVKATTTATITATYSCTGSDGKKVSRDKKVEVTVNKLEIPANAANDESCTLSLKKSKLSLKKDKDTELKVTLKPKKGGAVTGKEISVSSTNASIATATVEEKLSVDAKNNGTASISISPKAPGVAYILVYSRDSANPASYNLKRCKVTVTSPAEKVEITEDSMGKLNGKTLSLRKGQTDTLSYVITPENCSNANKIKWKGSGGVTVKNGVIITKKPTKAGKSAKVTLSIGKVKETIEVTVTE